MLFIHDGKATSPTLLFRIRDWRNTPAWQEFFRHYDALIERWCRQISLNAAAADEIRSNVWVELATRMQDFRYDPRKTFRGWLRDLCRCRTIDYLRKQRRESRKSQSIDDSDWAGAELAAADFETSEFEVTQPGNATIEQMQREAVEVQSAVRTRVNPRTWDVFWQTAVANRAIREVADEHGMTYAAAFEASARVGRLLREEGNRRLISRGWESGATGHVNLSD